MSLDVVYNSRDKRISATVKIWDRNYVLRRELRIYGNGRITCKEWDGKEVEISMGWKEIMDPIDNRFDLEHL